MKTYLTHKQLSPVAPRNHREPYHLILIILFVDDSFLLGSLDDLSHCMRMKCTENSPEEFSWRQILVWIIREVVFHLRKLIKSFLIDEIKCELIILRHVWLLNVFNFQSLDINEGLTTLSPERISFRKRIGVYRYPGKKNCTERLAKSLLWSFITSYKSFFEESFDESWEALTLTSWTLPSILL